MADKKISALTSASTPLAGTEVLPIVQSSTTKQVSIANVTAGRAVSTLTTTALGPNAIPITLQEITAAPVSATAAYVGVTTSAFPGGSNGDLVLIPRTSSAADVRVYVGSGTPTEALVVQGSTKDVRVQTGNLVIGTAAKGIDFSANPDAPGMTSELLNYYAEGTGTATRSGFTEVLGGGTITSTYYYTRVGRTVFMNITLVCAGGASISWGGSGTAAFTGLPFTAATYAVGQWLNTTNLATTGPTAWISTTMYVAGAAATITTNNSFSFSGMFNV